MDQVLRPHREGFTMTENLRRTRDLLLRLLSGQVELP
jgi:hypothetical protein